MHIFTGIVSALATVSSVVPDRGGIRLAIDCAPVAAKAATGASIAINGVCLTVTALEGPSISFDVVPETLARTNLRELQAGDVVNVEPSLRAGEELGGHIVYGHVDTTTVVLSKHAEGNGARMWCLTPLGYNDVVAEKGYVALDGVSLTVAAIEQGQFAIALVPETLARTALGRKETGSTLNFEADPIARYVTHALRERDQTR